MNDVTLPRRNGARARLPAALAALALLAAACGSGDDGGGSGGGEVAVAGTDALQFEPTSLTASAGTVTVELTSRGATEHTFVIEELDDTLVVEAAGGETATGTVELEPGTYTYYCDIPGHRAAGMEGELTVS